MLCKGQTRFSSVHRHHPPSLLLKVAWIWPPKLQSVNNVSRTFQYLFWCCSPIDSFQSVMVLFFSRVHNKTLCSVWCSESFFHSTSKWLSLIGTRLARKLHDSLRVTNSFQPASKRLAQSPKPASTSPYWTSRLHSQRNVPASPSSVLLF